jgi:hypothetical protein
LVFRERLAVAMQQDWKEYLYCYDQYEDEYQEKLSKACAVVQSIRMVMSEQKIDGSKQDFWRMVSEELESNGTVSYLPINHRRLQQKVMATMHKPIVEVIDLPRLGNKNADKGFEEEIQSWMMQLRVMGQNYTNTWIVKKIAEMCTIVGYDCPSESWFANELKKEEVKFLTSAERFGVKSRLSQMYKGYIPLANALFAGDCWQVDATRINLLPFMKKVSINGVMKRREEFAIMIAIRDVHSGDLLGIHIDTSETGAGYINALRLAVQQTGHLPYEIVFDRFPGHNTDAWKLVEKNMERCGTKVTYAHKANGKAKLERFWSTFQTIFLQDSDLYYGEGIQSRRITARKNSEYLDKARKAALKSGWSFENAWDEIVGMVDCYRNRKLSVYKRNCTIDLSPRELYERSEKKNVVSMDGLQIAKCFFQFKDGTVSNDGMIISEFLQSERIYVISVEDYEVLKGLKRVTIGYDLDDLSKVYLFERDNTNNFYCEAIEQGRVQVYGPDANWKEHSKVKARNTAVDAKRKVELAEKMESAHEIHLILDGASSKKEQEDAESNQFFEEYGSADSDVEKVIGGFLDQM